MNKICRVVKNKSTGQWVAASELARGPSKGTSSAKLASALALALMGSGAAWAACSPGGSTTITGTQGVAQICTDESTVNITGAIINSLKADIAVSVNNPNTATTTTTTVNVSDSVFNVSNSAAGSQAIGLSVNATKGGRVVFTGDNTFNLGLSGGTAVLVRSGSAAVRGDAEINVSSSGVLNINNQGNTSPKTLDGLEATAYGSATIIHSGSGTIDVADGNAVYTRVMGAAGDAFINFRGDVSGNKIKLITRGDSDLVFPEDGNGGHGISAVINDVVNAAGKVEIYTTDNVEISTSGANSAGIRAMTKGGNLTITSAAKIDTTGVEAYGIGVTKNNGNYTVNNSGAIHTTNNKAHGIFVSGAGTLGNTLITNDGAITVDGLGASAIRAGSAAGNIDVAHRAGASITSTGLNTGSTGYRADAINVFKSPGTTGNVTIYVYGDINTSGSNRAAGAYAQINGVGNASVIGSGNITATAANIDDLNIYSYGLAATVGDHVNAQGNARVEYQTGTIKTGGINAFALYAGTANGEATVINTNGTLETTGATSHGIWARSLGNGNATAKNLGGTITTQGIESHAIYASTKNSSIATVVNSGTLKTTGKNSYGIYAEALHGDVSIVNTGNIQLSGAGTTVHGIRGQIISGGTGNVNIQSDGARIDSTGSGVYAVAQEGNSEIIFRNGEVIVRGPSQGVAAGRKIDAGAGAGATVKLYNSVIDARNTYGRDAVLVTGGIGGDTTLYIDANTQIHGGWSNGVDVATGVGLGGYKRQVINEGSIDALSDWAVRGSRFSTNGAQSTFDNYGTITGYMSGDDGDSIFNNYSSNSWNIRHFADTNGDGIRDTKAVAISDFGGGNDTFVNAGTGTIRLLAVNTAQFTDPTGEYVPVGALSMNNTGIVHGQLQNLNRFENAGTIDMSANGLAGDVLVISGGSTPGVASTNQFIANGGRVRLDTVLNEGGANSVSDMLVLDNTSLGANGANSIFINNVGGQGAVTQGNGIRVIEVLDQSTTGVFALGHDVLAGAYSYQLMQTGKDWYLTSYAPPTNPFGLRNTPTYRPDSGVNLANRQSVIEMMVPGLAGSGAAPNGISGSGAMRSNVRLGGQGSATDGTFLGQKSNSLWSFATANDSKGRAAGGQISYSAESYTLQVGGDRTFAVGDGLIQAGVMAHMSTVNSKSLNRLTGARATGDSDGYGFGLYATWFMKANDVLSPFIDTYMMYGRYSNTVKTRNNAQSKYHSNAFSFTVQGGYPIALTSNVILEPQAQLTYVNYGSQSYKDHGGTDINLKTKGNMIGRVGAYVYGHGYKVQPYGALNVWYDDTQSEMRYNTHSWQSSQVGSGKRGAIVEAKIGFQTQATSNLTLWGEVSGRVGQNSYRDVGGAIGLKYAW